MAKKPKVHITRWWRNIFVKRKYKDELFRKIFRNKKDLLELYNALNHTDYKDPDALEITTIDNAVYLSMKNDLSFIIGFVLNLYEHQSTFSPNLPLRGLSYFARLYETYVSRYRLNIYGSKPVPLPQPRYIVFYNGRDSQPDVQEIRLSDLFVPPPEPGCSPVLECSVQMLNINLGCSRQLMKNCRRLWEYATFIAEVNQNLDRGIPMERAVNTAIDTCIRRDILKDVLVQCKSEVLDMFLTEYDEKLHLKNSFNEGLEQGLEQGQNRILCLNQRLLSSSRLDDLILASKDEQYREKLLKEFDI